jgi:hypothetical protein
LHSSSPACGNRILACERRGESGVACERRRRARDAAALLLKLTVI